MSREQRLDLVRRAQLERAKIDFPAFLEWCITENDDGHACPLPVTLTRGLPDPLQDLIDSGEVLPRPSPWPHVDEMALDLASGRNLIYLKSRQMLFSWILACFNLYESLQRGHMFVLSLGQDESDEVILKIKYVFEKLPRELRLTAQTWNTSNVAFKKGGSVKSFPSTENAVRSLSGRKVFSDEAAFHRYAAENFRAYQPAISGANGQHVIVSTANGPHGWFHTFFQNAYTGLNDYNWRFYPWNARPDRDKAWYDRTRRAYAGFDADFLREYPSTIEEAFSQLSGVVYPSFNPQIHVAPARVSYEECMWRGAGVDFGGSAGNPNAVAILGFTRDGHVHQYDEFAPAGVLSIEEIGGFISKWRQRAPMITVECDHQETAIQTLRKTFGLPARRAEKKREGLEITDFLLQNNRLTIDPACTKSIEEFYGYRWREALDPNSRERYQTKTPVDNHADCFVAGTLVETARGQIPIESVTIDDLVLTRAGFFPVLASGVSSLAEPTFTLTLSDGRSLSGTGEHPVWVAGVGFTHLDALRYGDRVAVCNHSTATTTARPDAGSTGTRPAGKTEARCTGTCGSSTTAHSQRSTRYTTATTIRTTTTSSILSLSPNQFMPLTTGDSIREFRGRLSPKHQNGTDPQKGVNGTVSTVARFTRHGSWCNSCANSAGNSSSLALAAMSDSAIQTARQVPYVLDAKPTGRIEPVYNLTVEGQPEFYANGVLVHNCMDARRYVLRRFWKQLMLTSATVQNASGRPVKAYVA